MSIEPHSKISDVLRHYPDCYDVFDWHSIPVNRTTRRMALWEAAEEYSTNLDDLIDDLTGFAVTDDDDDYDSYDDD